MILNKSYARTHRHIPYTAHVETQVIRWGYCTPVLNHLTRASVERSCTNRVPANTGNSPPTDLGRTCDGLQIPTSRVHAMDLEHTVLTHDASISRENIYKLIHAHLHLTTEWGLPEEQPATEDCSSHEHPLTGTFQIKHPYTITRPSTPVHERVPLSISHVHATHEHDRSCMDDV